MNNPEYKACEKAWRYEEAILYGPKCAKKPPPHMFKAGFLAGRKSVESELELTVDLPDEPLFSIPPHHPLKD